MVTTTISDTQIDAYLDGMARGVQLAETYHDEEAGTAPRFYIDGWVRKLVLVLLVVSIIGWIYGLAEMTGIVQMASFVPGPAANAAAPASVTMLTPAVHAAQTLQGALSKP